MPAASGKRTSFGAGELGDRPSLGIGSDLPKKTANDPGVSFEVKLLRPLEFGHLKSQTLAVDKENYRVSPGMQVAGEIHLGTRSILEYVLSPVQKAWHEAGRER